MTSTSTSSASTNGSHRKRKLETNDIAKSKKHYKGKTEKKTKDKTGSNSAGNTSINCRDIVRKLGQYVFQVNNIKPIHPSGIRGLDTLICLYGGEDAFIDAKPYVPIVREPWHGLMHVVHGAWQNRETLVLEPNTFLMLIIQGLVMKRSLMNKTPEIATSTAAKISKPANTSENKMDWETLEMIRENTATIVALLSKICHTHILPVAREGAITSLHNFCTKCMVRRRRETHVDYPISLLETSLDTERSRTRPGFGRIVLQGAKSEWLAMFVTARDLLKEMPWWKKYAMPILAHIVKVRMGTDHVVVDGSKTFQHASHGHYDNTRTFWNQMYFVKVHGLDLQVHGWINAFFPFTIDQDAIHSKTQDLDVFEWANGDHLPWVKQEVELELELDTERASVVVAASSATNGKASVDSSRSGQDIYKDKIAEDAKTLLNSKQETIQKLNHIIAKISGRSPLAFPSGLVQSQDGVVFGFEGMSESRLIQSSGNSASLSSATQYGLMHNMDARASASQKRDTSSEIANSKARLQSVLFWTCATPKTSTAL